MENKICFDTPQALDVPVEEYVRQIKQMIIDSIEQEPTLVLHPDEQIAKRFETALIGMQDGQIIANTNIYPTGMTPLDEVVVNGQRVKIGECGSTIVKLGERYKGLGKKLSHEAFAKLGPNFDALVAATVNPRMYGLRLKMGFEDVRFPQTYYEEGKTHLSPKMKGGVEEFEQRAKCVMHFQNVDENTRQAIFDILNNQ